MKDNAGRDRDAGAHPRLSTASGASGWFVRNERFLRAICMISVYVFGAICLISILALGTFAFISGILLGLVLAAAMLMKSREVCRAGISSRNARRAGTRACELN